MFQVRVNHSFDSVAEVVADSGCIKGEIIGLMCKMPGVTAVQWYGARLLASAAPDLKRALMEMMYAYANELGVPVEACDKGVFAQAWAALRKAEGAA